MLLDVGMSIAFIYKQGSVRREPSALLLRSLNNPTPPSSHLPRRLSLGERVVSDLAFHLNLRDPFDTAVFALATCAF
jgi:hypothetical protein